jgi:hypothetical protein
MSRGRVGSCPHVKAAGLARLSSTYRIDNGYQDAVASTRATWDGEAAGGVNGHDSGGDG